MGDFFKNKKSSLFLSLKFCPIFFYYEKKSQISQENPFISGWLLKATAFMVMPKMINALTFCF